MTYENERVDDMANIVEMLNEIPNSRVEGALADEVRAVIEAEFWKGEDLPVGVLDEVWAYVWGEKRSGGWVELYNCYCEIAEFTRKVLSAR